MPSTNAVCHALAASASWPDAANADENYWRTTCVVNCDITRLEQANSGYLFPAHRVMPHWVDGVNWLKLKGITA